MSLSNLGHSTSISNTDDLTFPVLQNSPETRVLGHLPPIRSRRKEATKEATEVKLFGVGSVRLKNKRFVLFYSMTSMSMLCFIILFFNFSALLHYLGLKLKTRWRKVGSQLLLKCADLTLLHCMHHFFVERSSRLQITRASSRR